MTTSEPSKTDATQHVEGTTDVVEAIHVAELAQDTHYSPWTLSMFRLYGVLLVGYFGACLNGYDGSLMG